MSQQPNVLFFIADDHRASAIHAYGDPTVRTPVLDGLCADGVSFRRNVHMGGLSGAVCIPTRACLHTGAHVFRATTGNDMADPQGIHTLRPEHTYLAEHFRAAGYHTFATGKWHNDRASFARSFGDARNVFFGGMGDHDRLPVQDFDPEGKYEPSRAQVADRFSTDLFGDTAIEFLESYQEDAPFFLYCAFTAPHDPRTPPPDWADAYPPEAMPLPANFMSQHPFDNGELWVRDEKLAAFPRTPEEVRRHIADYYGMISDMDDKIGQVLAALERQGLAENTLVVYTADHGLAVGQHGLLGKQNLYEHSVRVPLILRGPGVPAGRAVEALSYTYDIYPTLCELAGLPVPEHVDAQSLAPLLHGGQGRAAVCSVYKDNQRMVTDGPWKLIRYARSQHGGADREQLFHLTTDPWELWDLSQDPQHRERKEALRRQLSAWQESVQDPWAGLHAPSVRRGG